MVIAVQNHKKEPCGTALVQLQIHVRQQSAGFQKWSPGTWFAFFATACASVASKFISIFFPDFSSDKKTQAASVGLGAAIAWVFSANCVNMRLKVTSGERVR